MYRHANIWDDGEHHYLDEDPCIFQETQENNNNCSDGCFTTKLDEYDFIFTQFSHSIAYHLSMYFSLQFLSTLLFFFFVQQSCKRISQLAKNCFLLILNQLISLKTAHNTLILSLETLITPFQITKRKEDSSPLMFLPILIVT